MPRQVPFFLGLMLFTFVTVHAPCVLAEASQQLEPSGSESERQAQARASFERGRVALELGNFSLALRSFERAYDLSGRPELLFNIGTVFDRMRHDADAARHFERYLQALPEADNRQAVEARIAVLKQRLAAQAPSPVQLAESQVAQEQASPYLAAAPARGQDDTAVPLRKKWWLWTGIAVVAAGGVVAAVLLTRDDDETQEAPLVGSQGAFTQALGRR